MTIIPIITLIIVLIVWFKQYEKSFFQKPPNYPDFQKINKEDRPIFIAFGDSHTQGNMGANWVEKLEKRQPSLQYFNAGMNADLTYTLLDRIEDVLHCQPKYISLLIGTNDIAATMSAERMKRYYDLGKITQDADFEGFKFNYETILDLLQTGTTAKIFCISLPPITEDFTYETNIKADIYSKTIQEIALRKEVTYIPFREKLKEQMPVKSDQLVDFDKITSLIRKAALKKYFLGNSWNEIAKARKAVFLTDNIHFNDQAAEILAQMIEEELNNNIPQTAKI